MKKRNSVLLIHVMVLCAIIFSSCGKIKSKNIDSSFIDIQNIIIQTVKENYEDGDISESDIEIAEIHYGTFSQSIEKELFVICNILNQPHVAGLDKAVCFLLTADSLEMKAYKEFASDDTVIKCFLAEDGLSRILVSEKTTYQGITSQDIQFFMIKDKQWIEIPIDALDGLETENFFFVTEDAIIVTSNNYLTDASDIIAVLTWNPDVGEFLAADNQKSSKVEISMEDAISLGLEEASKYYDNLYLTEVHSYDNDEYIDQDAGENGKRQWWYVNFANEEKNYVSILICDGAIDVVEPFDSNGNTGLLNLSDISLTAEVAASKAKEKGLIGGNPDNQRDWASGYNFKLSYGSLAKSSDDVRILLEVIGVSPNGNFAHIDFDASTGEVLLAEERIEHSNGEIEWKEME